jgi:hypothetical protein
MSKVLLDIFVLAVLIAYYIDYRNEKKLYGTKGRATLYILIVCAILFMVLRRIFF